MAASMTERDETAPATVPPDEPGTPPAAPAPDASRDGADVPGGAPAGGAADRPVEIGGQKGPEPTRYGDWEGRGRCTDF